jgi:hypothetical protein
MVPPEAALKDEIIVEQRAYYAKTDGACKNAHSGCSNSAALHNYGMCGRCRYGWWPKPGKHGCQLLGPAFAYNAGNGVQFLCDCGLKKCQEIGHVSDADRVELPWTQRRGAELRAEHVRALPREGRAAICMKNAI